MLISMTQPDDLESRVTALEGEVRGLAERVRHSEQDAAAARVLAGAADRDVSEFRAEIRDFRQATTASFNAMREDLIDLRQEMNERFTQVNERFAQVDERFVQVDERFVQVDNGFIEMRGKLDAAAAGQQQIVRLLNTLIDRQAS
jgi:chromosome segregation ATPase